MILIVFFLAGLVDGTTLGHLCQMILEIKSAQRL